MQSQIREFEKINRTLNTLKTETIENNTEEKLLQKELKELGVVQPDQLENIIEGKTELLADLKEKLTNGINELKEKYDLEP